MTSIKKFLILDCFVDEPACFGVPPFMAPYPRNIYGALIAAGIDGDAITYKTIDYCRKNGFTIDLDYDCVFLIGGAVVPGKYLGQKIGTVAEISKIINNNHRLHFAVGGLIARVIQPGDGHVILISGDIEKYAFNHARGSAKDGLRSTGEIASWSVMGAGIVRQHPDYPHLICEIETSRGCPRKNHCSFCSEGLIENIEFRETRDIIAEIDALIHNGISRFRIGRQADILQYKTEFLEFKNGFPRPSVTHAAGLFNELRKKKENGAISVLNIDNANPGTISNFPDESARILEAITDAVTPGDTIALGFESFDQNVIKKNNLKVDADEAMRVIQMINDIGGKRKDGLPVLLPGINLLHGLTGESMETFRINYDTLCGIRESGLLIKRINIRKVHPFPGTAIHANPPRIAHKIENRFEYYRDKIRSDIDNHMLERIYPSGTVLAEIMIMESRAGYSYGKQIASYSITVKIPYMLPLNSFQTVLVIGHQERSLTALPLPIDINTLPQKALEAIPGIGKKKSGDIIIARPFASSGEAASYLSDVPKLIRDIIII